MASDVPIDDLVPRPPRLPRQLEEGEAGELVHDATYTDASLADVVWSDRHADGVQLGMVRLVNADLSDSRLEKLKVTDGELTRCNLANMQGRGAQVTRGAIDTSRLTGISLPRRVARRHDSGLPR